MHARRSLRVSKAINYAEVDSDLEDEGLNWDKLELGVLMKQSTIPEAGRGVFATIDFQKDDVVTEYIGRIISVPTMRKLTEGRRCWYIAQIGGKLFIDGRRFRGPIGAQLTQLGSMVNDSRGQVPWNVRLHACPRQKRLFLVAQRPIAPGDELFLNYGTRYWQYKGQ